MTNYELRMTDEKRSGKTTRALSRHSFPRQARDKLFVIHHSRKGLTLIELLITLGISIILLTIFVPSFRTFEEKNKLRQTAQQVRWGLQSANAYALAPRQGSLRVKRYEVTLTKDTTQAQNFNVEEVIDDNGIERKVIVTRNTLPMSVYVQAITDVGRTNFVDMCTFGFEVGQRVTYSLSQSCATAIGTGNVKVWLRNKHITETDSSNDFTDDAIILFDRVTGNIAISP